MKSWIITGALATLIGLTLAACERSGSAPQAAQQSFQQVMQAEIDAPADKFWAASGIVFDEQGQHNLTPRNDAEWGEVRAAVLTIIAATDKLTTLDRPLVQPGGKIGDEGLESVATPDWIRTAFLEQRPLLIQRAATLRSISREALAAVDRRDIAAIDAIGERLDAACEACHESFWYPPSASPQRKTPLVLPTTPPSLRP